MYRPTSAGESTRFFAALESNHSHFIPNRHYGSITYSGDYLYLPWDTPGFGMITISPGTYVDALFGRRNPLSQPLTADSIYRFHKADSSRVYDYREDMALYGGFLSRNSGLSTFASEFSKENRVRHDRYNGDVEDLTSPYVPVWNHVFHDSYGTEYHNTVDFGWTHVHGYTSIGVNPSGTYLYQIWTGGREDDASQLVGLTFDSYYWMKVNRGRLGVINSMYHNQDGIRLFNTLLSEDSFLSAKGTHIRAHYHHKVVDDSYGVYADFDVNLIVDLLFDMSPDPRENVGSSRRILSTALQINNYSTVSPIGPTKDLDDYSPVGESIVSSPIKWNVGTIASTPTDAGDQGIAYRIYPYTGVSGGNGTSRTNLENFAPIRDEFRRFCTRVLPSVRPASFLAASDGLKGQLDILNTNMLQVLQHAQELTGLFPDIPELAKVLIRISQGDYTALKDLVDVLADIWLTIKFRDEPAIKLADKVSKTDFLSRFGSLLSSESFICHGKFDWVFPDEENPFQDGTISLAVRSKSRVSIDLTTAMMAYLLGDSLGLIPNLERIWNLLPFSFVVDWFTNESKRLRNVDSSVKWLCVNHNWSLYSYKITWIPSAEFLASHGLASVRTDKPFGLSVYVREKSLITPRLLESRFDFLRATQSPDVKTVGALLWHLL